MKWKVQDPHRFGVTKKEYHRKGIARAIFRYLPDDILAEAPGLDALMLDFSPYGLPFTGRLGPFL